MRTVVSYLLLYGSLIVLLVFIYARIWRKQPAQSYSTDIFAKAMTACITAWSILVSFSSALCFWIVKEYRISIEALGPLLSAIIIFLLMIPTAIYALASIATEEEAGKIEISPSKNYGFPIVLAVQSLSIIVAFIFMFIFMSTEFLPIVKNQRASITPTIAAQASAQSIDTTLFFGPGESKLTADHMLILESLLTSVNATRTAAEISGHADSTGGDDYNLELSRRRAESVKNHLSSKGFSKERIKTDFFGERRLVASDETAAGRQANRRVTVRIFFP